MTVLKLNMLPLRMNITLHHIYTKMMYLHIRDTSETKEVRFRVKQHILVGEENIIFGHIIMIKGTILNKQLSGIFRHEVKIVSTIRKKNLGIQGNKEL